MSNVYTVDIDANQRYALRPRIPVEDREPNHASFDVGLLEFEDDGTFRDATQLTAIADQISTARQVNKNGVIVVLFIHGWKHGAGWNSPTDGDSHFRAFRRVLGTLAIREIERYDDDGPLGRRVIGIYAGWNGTPDNPLVKLIPGATNFSFWTRYQVAERIGSGDAIRNAIQTITTRTKAMANGLGDGQLILTGHSMGGLILESALLALLEQDDGELLKPDGDDTAKPVKTHIDGQRVLFPDAVISLNSAADSEICRKTKTILEDRKVTKRAEGSKIAYAPPLIVSVTSKSDKATGIIWAAAKPGKKTIGHDEALFTHRIDNEGGPVTATPGNTKDLGQNFHCLRPPEPANCATPSIAIDLPVRDRDGANDFPDHSRYRLIPLEDEYTPEPVWNFQVSDELMDGHNDIFNSRSGCLLLALMQISGAVASLAEDWEASFETQGYP